MNNQQSMEDVFPNISSKKDITEEIESIKGLQKKVIQRNLIFVKIIKAKNNLSPIYNFQNYATIAFFARDIYRVLLHWIN